MTAEIVQLKIIWGVEFGDIAIGIPGQYAIMMAVIYALAMHYWCMMIYAFRTTHTSGDKFQEKCCRIKFVRVAEN